MFSDYSFSWNKIWVLYVFFSWDKITLLVRIKRKKWCMFPFFIFFNEYSPSRPSSSPLSSIIGPCGHILFWVPFGQFGKKGTKEFLKMGSFFFLVFVSKFLTFLLYFHSFGSSYPLNIFFSLYQWKFIYYYYFFDGNKTFHCCNEKRLMLQIQDTGKNTESSTITNNTIRN